MPSHAAEALSDNDATLPEVLLIRGIFEVTQENYVESIRRYKQALVMYFYLQFYCRRGFLMYTVD